MIQTDLLVIGAGPGGYVAAIKAAKLGKKVVLADRHKLGGECLNYGCIPSKALISVASLVHKAKKAADIGVTVDVKVDWTRVQQWKAGVLAGMNKGVASLTKGNGVEVMMGEARFTGLRTAEVKTASGTETVSFQNAIVVTGSKPVSLPGFPIDGRDVIGSKEALELPQIPGALLVIGGGVIGLEIGTFYAKLGAQVTVVELTPGLLPGTDPDLVAPVARSLQKLGVAVHLQSKALGFSRKDGVLEVTVETPEGPKTIQADHILLSVGRAPVTDGLGLEAAGVLTDGKGFIKVNGRFETAASGIYAAGDVIGPPFLAHKASREGILAAMAIAGEEAEPRGSVPWAIFTDPEVSSAGITEAEAKAQGLETMTGRFPFSASGRAQTSRDLDGFVKVIAEKGSGKVLGVGVVGPGASDMISEAALAIKLGATVHDIASTIHPHPTLPEALLEAAEATTGQAIHILARRA